MLNEILYLTVTPESDKLQNNFQVQLLKKTVSTWVSHSSQVGAVLQF